MFNLPNLSAKNRLLAGASFATLLIAAPAAQATTLGGMTGRTSAQINATINPATNRPGGPLSPGAAAQKTSQSTADFSTALARIQGQLSAQASARSVAATGPNNLGMDPNHPGQQLPDVPNGLGAGGLAPSANVSVDPSLWQNADAPTQTTSGANTTVTVHQNAQKAILTWDSFNVGKNTTVHFDQTGGAQSDGTNNWIALNRIVDPSDRPSQILGNITAEGSVYLINNNGIIFGGSSQINVHSLIASSLSFLGENINGLTPGSTAYDDAVKVSNNTFLTTGVAGLEATGVGGSTGNVVLGMGSRITLPTINDYQAPGDIVINEGASISSHTNGSQGNGGYILIAGSNVSNAGAISAEDGQAILAAGIGVSFLPGAGSTASILQPLLTGQIYAGSGINFRDATPVANLTNTDTGLIQAARGTINLLGTNVTQNGAVEATTGVSYPGSIVITAADELTIPYNINLAYPRAGHVSFGATSITSNLPDEDGETATSSPTASFTPGSVAITGGSISFLGGSLLEAPGAKVTVAAQVASISPVTHQQNIPGDPNGTAVAPVGDTAVAGRVYIDTGATIDVAGLANVELPVASTLVTIPLITQNEIAGNPNQKDLLGLTNIVVDSTLAGTTSDGVSWIGTSILNASGYAQLIARKIDELLTNAGSVTLSGNEVLTATGSSINLDGGYTHYLGGNITTTRLIDQNGLSTSIGNANPGDVYVGIAGVNTLNHNRWGITDEYTNSLIAGGYYQPDYIQGGNAGSLTIFGHDAVVLDGAMSAQAIAGLKQVAAGTAPSGSAAGGSFLPVGGTFDLGDGGALSYVNQFTDTNETGSFIIQKEAPQLTTLDSDFNGDTAFDTAVLKALDPNDPNNVLTWRTIPADTLSAGGFANVKINAGDGTGLVVAQDATLSVTPGGSIAYKATLGGPITILGKLLAPAGTISLETDSGTTNQVGASGALVTGQDITVGANAVLSTAGLWVNDSDLLSAPGSTTFADGGSISLTAGVGASILLEQGSLLDVSSGGALLAGGLVSNNGVPVGQAGSILLSTWNFFPNGANGNFEPTTQPTTGTLVMDGTIKGYGFSGGGKLTLQALGFQIGGDPTTAPSWDITLPADFFAKQGFGSYQINALYDTTIAPGANVRLTQQNLLPNLAALYLAPSGADITQGGLTTLGTLDPYHRQATNLVLAAGGYATWLSSDVAHTNLVYDNVSGAVTVAEGASINADAGASIGLGSPWQVTVLGSIAAPGGSITLSGDTQGYYGLPGYLPGGTNVVAFTTNSKSVWLGANAVLDVSGTTLINPYAAPVLVNQNLQTPVSGRVLNGGSVILSNDTGFVVAQAGSIIDVSGTSALLDAPQASASGDIFAQSYAPQTFWSNAGSIVLGAGSGLMFDGTIRAQGGSAQAEGGTLTILPESRFINNSSGPVKTVFADYTAITPGATALIIQQSGDLASTGLQPGQDFAPATGVLQFAADRLDNSGVSSLILGGAGPGKAGVFANFNPVAIGFAGDVELSLSRAVTITAPQIVALAAGATAIPVLVAANASIGGTSVTINAAYVDIAGPVYANGTPQFSAIQAASDATLNVNAGFLDLQNQVGFANFGALNLTSSGDIRLSSIGVAGAAIVAPGLLFTPGNLTLKASDIYPASGGTFILDAKGPNPTTITFESNGTSATPLSAGGSLLVDADNIIQSGTLRAPFGTIVLGVGDINDTTTQAQFDNIPLMTTQSVSLNDGSLTSVSADSATLPYGTTIDGTDWVYGNLSTPPAKTISLNGTAIVLNKGGTVDLSGGGELQAEEWVPGTGGARDVLSQYNISYASSSTGATVPLYADARNVYAVLPGYSTPVAAYDPVFAQEPNPAIQGQVTTLGVGQAGAGDAVGKAVYLSGVPGLPAGVYTLLPAKYATLPGAFRVVQNTGATNVIPGRTTTLADGTDVVTGYFEDALNGARSATPSQFEVQSAATWGKYSQYNLTSADTFFATQAASVGTVTPALPMDAGQLVLAATSSLKLGAALNTAPAKGGAPAEVDIASQDIQITGSGEAALPGYLQLSASDLDALNAGSLLIGGTRTRTSAGVTILADANSIVVSNDAQNPLTGPEIILVTKTDTTGTDANAVNGLRLDPGSVITAAGTLPTSASLPLTIGSTTVSGDGALVRVSNAAQVAITRVNVPTTALGSLTVAAGASVNGGAALLLDSSGALNFDPAATFSGTEIAIDAPSITITGNSDNTGLTGFVVGPNSLAQFANSKQVDLRSYSNLAFNGNLNLNFGENVDFSAGNFTGDGGTVTISAPTVAFTNDLNAPSNNTPVPGQGNLVVDATEIDLGSGNKSLKGFSSVAMTATGGIVGQDTGTFDMGGADVTMAAPLYVADTGSGTTLTTTGNLTLNSNSGTALTITPVGGAISFTGASLADNGATIEAPAGNVSLEATTGDLDIASGSLVSSAGVAKQFYDVTAYAPGGAITLTADQGTVNIASGSTLDFSGANGGGAAGSLSLSAPVQTVVLNGTVKGNAATGYLGGSFSLNTGGAVDLDALATELAASGVNDAITVQTHAGNLTLSAASTITAHAVSLTADGGTGGQGAAEGNVTINGTIDASGSEGGEIDLYGKSSVDLEGSLIARGTSTTERGGTVNIGTVSNVVGSTAQIDPTYGYEEVSAANSGSITLGANALIDVSGGTKGGLSGGTVSFRAPLLDAADNHDVNVLLPTSFNPGKGIIGSRATTLEAYAVWSTDDPVTNGAAQHFDGIVDPAGWYNATGTLLAGAFTDAAGNTVAAWDGATLTNSDSTTNNLSYYLTNDYFAPTAGNTDASRSAHETFYGYVNGDATAAAPGTLMGFIENFPISTTATARFAGVQNFAVTPGIELDNPDTNINGGNISILTNWNLGAGASATNLTYRFNGQAPIITFKAQNDVKVDASLSDGFFQIENPTAPPLRTVTITPPTPSDHHDAYREFYYNHYYYLYPYPGGLAGPKYGFQYSFAGYNRTNWHDFAKPPAPESDFTGGNPTQISQYYGLYKEYLDYLSTPFSIGRDFVLGNVSTGHLNSPVVPGQPTFTESVPTAAQETASPGAYLGYLQDYEDYIVALQTFQNHSSVGVNLAPLDPPPIVLTAPITGGSSTVGTIPTDNTPSPISNPINGFPLQSASLVAGASSSFRIVAGADLANPNPDALQAVGKGSVSIDGHTAFVDTNRVTIFEPTMIRTGIGSINIAAANDVVLLDTTAPGVIYTAGAPATGAPTGTTAVIVPNDPNTNTPTYDLLVTPTVSPDSGGNVSIHAQNDIIGVENTAGGGAGFAQFWYPWMEIGVNPTVSLVPLGGGATTQTQITQTSINFGAFDQGVMSVGGDVAITAGGNIQNLAVSLPTTWYLTNNNTVVNTVGGGNLTVKAGGDILAGDYFVASGTGTLTAGGLIGSGGLTQTGQFGSVAEVSTILALQDAVLNVSARRGADIGGVLDPSYAPFSGFSSHADDKNYSATSAVNISSATGDLDFNTLATGGVSAAIGSGILPANVSLTAFSGGITIARNGTLYPSSTGELSLIADQSIQFYGGGGAGEFGMSDASPSAMPSPLNADLLSTDVNFVNVVAPGALYSTKLIDHSPTPLHADDTQPVRIYSLDGSIISGFLETSGQKAGAYDQLMSIVVDKPAQIYAGSDILNLDFSGQNLRDDDVTRIVAGRDILVNASGLFTPNRSLPSLVLGGPGTFDVEAGRNIGMPNGSELTASNPYAGTSLANVPASGILAIGNSHNPYLAHESADVSVLFGVGPGIANAPFIAAYVDPAVAAPDIQQGLVAFMEAYDGGGVIDTGLVKDKLHVTLTIDQAWAQFQTLPSYVQQIFNQKALFTVLTDVDLAYNDPASPFYHQYARGYQAINTLFPSSLGYTANSLEGGKQGADTLVNTGNLDIRSNTIQTQQGGDVTILGPGGQALVGAAAAPPAFLNLNGQLVHGLSNAGIFTLETGNLNIFTDQSLLLAQSRVFTEQGGDMTIWSSNGDINAGKGAKTVADVPTPIYVCDSDFYCTRDARGEVTGAGIATLQTIPGSPPGNVYLIAPRGTVDAGAAGIRVSGDLFVSALAVANASNIQVQGKSVGLPPQPVTNLTLTTASTAATEAALITNSIKAHQPQIVVDVEITGFGGDNSDAPEHCIPSAISVCR